jgi:hypothetical protein
MSLPEYTRHSGVCRQSQEITSRPDHENTKTMLGLVSGRYMDPVAELESRWSSAAEARGRPEFAFSAERLREPLVIISTMIELGELVGCFQME